MFGSPVAYPGSCTMKQPGFGKSSPRCIYRFKRFSQAGKVGGGSRGGGDGSLTRLIGPALAPI